MKLTAMMVMHNEAGRYLSEALESLLDFCDSVAILDDGSTDNSAKIVRHHSRIALLESFRSTFYENEGHTRQTLLDFTIMEEQPTHILAIDADEFVADGTAVRKAIEIGNPQGVWGLQMQEVWRAEEDHLQIRIDHHWKPHPVPILFEVPTRRDGNWRISPRALACGREPMTVAKLWARSRVKEPVTEILHFGWACEADRNDRYQRYVTHDSGVYHNNAHLESIMWPEEQVGLMRRAWPATIDKDHVYARTSRGRVPS